MDLGYSESEAWHFVYVDKNKVIPKLGVDSRYLMETMGTKWGREMVHSELWTMLAFGKADNWLSRGHTLVFDDLRFPNEWAGIKARGGLLVRIVRPDAKKRDSYAEGLLDHHEFHTTIINDRDTDYLHDQSVILMDKVDAI